MGGCIVAKAVDELGGEGVGLREWKSDGVEFDGGGSGKDFKCFEDVVGHLL